MPRNSKKTSTRVASKAAKVLKDPKASKTAKKLAGSALSQVNKGNQTGAVMEGLASRVLDSEKYSKETKTFAGSVVSQANKER
ncbi:hypothetical protein BH24DEI2_BH24DEI2_10560 [soil metagenome]